jgi:hypothetical protein
LLILLLFFVFIENASNFAILKSVMNNFLHLLEF